MKILIIIVVFFSFSFPHIINIQTGNWIPVRESDSSLLFLNNTNIRSSH